MDKLKILDVLSKLCIDVLLDVDLAAVTPDATLDGLGINSIDRLEILVDTLDEIGLVQPVTRLKEVAGMSLLDISETFASWTPGTQE